MGQSLRDLRDGPEDCPICEGPCTHELERGAYVLGGPMDAHPSRKKEREEVEPVPQKRPKGKRRPAEDRARHRVEDR
jgi:hypothetical protein